MCSVSKKYNTIALLAWLKLIKSTGLKMLPKVLHKIGPNISGRINNELYICRPI